MPSCKNCGNSQYFACQFFSAGSSNPYGLTANFDQFGNLTAMEALGASLDEAQEAFENQKFYFNICGNCGGNDIVW